MDSLKRPEMIVSVATATGLVGSVIYFYKRENAMQEELNKLSENLVSAINKIKTIQISTQTHDNHILQIVEGLKQLNSLIGEHNKSIEDLGNTIKDLQNNFNTHLDAIEDIRATLDEVIGSLEENNIQVSYPHNQWGRRQNRGKYQSSRKPVGSTQAKPKAKRQVRQKDPESEDPDLNEDDNIENPDNDEIDEEEEEPRREKLRNPTRERVSFAEQRKMQAKPKPVRSRQNQEQWSEPSKLTKTDDKVSLIPIPSINKPKSKPMALDLASIGKRSSPDRVTEEPINKDTDQDEIDPDNDDDDDGGDDLAAHVAAVRELKQKQDSKKKSNRS